MIESWVIGVAAGVVFVANVVTFETLDSVGTKPFTLGMAATLILIVLIIGLQALAKGV